MRMKLRLIRFFLVLWATCVSVYADARRSPADYDVLRGTVVVKVFGDHAVVIGIISERGKEEGNIDLFRLETEGILQPLNVVLKSASVEYRGSELVVMDATSQTFYTFSVSGAEFTAPRAPAGFNSVRYVGYGLNHSIRPMSEVRPSNGRAIKAQEEPCEWTVCFFDQDPYGDGGGGGGSSCNSGGRGAASCSITVSGSGCSVSCSSGYYACCTQAGPNCYCNPN
jgi:hypothetical protein